MDLLTLPNLSDLSEFHFLRPLWFVAIIPLLLLTTWIKRRTSKQSGWQSIIPSHLYQHMVTGKFEKGQRPPFWLLSFVWCLSVIALAGPTWERLPQPVYQLKMGHVIVLDMSLSMRATDMTPDRLTRAKYKAIDLVNAIGEGEMGLVAYAGDAFVISPLTEDAANVTTLLPSLAPEIMPVPGSDPLLGIQSAAELLTNAGYNTGMIYWITDGIDFEQQKELQEYVSSLPFTVNALTVGTAQGAPIRQLSGELLKDSTGSIVIPKLNNSAVRGVVKSNGGNFQTFTSNDRDINALATLSMLDRDSAEDEDNETDAQGDQWREVGPYVIIFLLPFAAYAFRKGLIFAVLVGILSFSSNKPVYAQQIPSSSSEEITSTTPNNIPWWKKPFLNDDQEALSHYQGDQYSEAASQFDDIEWKASSLYKAENYEAALEAYEQIPGAESLYNQGNTLAKLGELQKAIDKYEEALAMAPDMQDAKFNKKLIEDLLEQQQNQQDQKDNNGQQSNDQQDSENQDSSSDDQQSNEGQQDQQSQDSDSEQQQDENSDSSQKSNENESEPNSQQDESSSNDDDNQQQSDQSEQDQDDSEQQKDSSQESDEQKQDENDERTAEAMQPQQGELSDAEKEELQRMESLMRRVPDDPAFLLKRKMQLEAQKRQRQRMPSNRSDW